MSPLVAMRWLWGLWFISWIIAARWSNRTEARPAVSSEFLYRVITLTGVALLFLTDRSGAGIGPRLWGTPPEFSWPLVGIAFAGFAFCWWARIHLGRLWSMSVTRKESHHVVDTGPYAFVRHPIYTGIIVASLATAAQQATVGTFAGVVLVIVGFWIKARLEERFLREQLGAQDYDAYARRTGMLFPGF